MEEGKKELNVETQISPRSSFRSVPFEKKESFFFRSVPLPFIWMPGLNNQEKWDQVVIQWYEEKFKPSLSS